MSKIGDRIKKCRIARGLTQKELGKLCNMPDSQIRKYENGVIEPKNDTLARIADGLEVSIYALLGLSGTVYEKDYLDDLEYIKDEYLKHLGISKTFIKYLSSLGYSLQMPNVNQYLNGVLDLAKIKEITSHLIFNKNNIKHKIKYKDFLEFQKIHSINTSNDIEKLLLKCEETGG